MPIHGWQAKVLLPLEASITVALGFFLLFIFSRGFVRVAGPYLPSSERRRRNAQFIFFYFSRYYYMQRLANCIFVTDASLLQRRWSLAFIILRPNWKCPATWLDTCTLNGGERKNNVTLYNKKTKQQIDIYKNKERHNKCPLIIAGHPLRVPLGGPLSRASYRDKKKIGDKAGLHKRVVIDQQPLYVE